MIGGWITMAACGVTVVVLGAYTLQSRSMAALEAEVDTLTRNNAALEAQAKADAEARAVHREYIKEAEARAALAETLLVELQSMEGSDAPASAYLRGAGERLWP